MKRALISGLREEKGQGLVEYTLIVLLVALVFWVAVRSTNIGNALGDSWNNIKDCLTDPLACKGP
jgi:Flp pilus assembly pilin Flp